MLQRFLQNTAISAIAYGVAGVLGLLAVGVIARSYGLTVLGLIVLVRSFLPTGLLSLVDFGASELATQAVARGRVGGWTAASEKVSLLAVMTAVVGFLSGVLLWFGGPLIVTVFNVGPDQAEAFVAILKVTAVLLPVAFLGLVVEGIFKGFERYGWLRLTEIGSNVAYVLAVYALVWRGAAFEWIAYAYLATLVAKYLVLVVVLWPVVWNTPLRFATWSAESRQDVLHRCWLMFNGRIGGALQQTVIPIAIGALYGPAEVGAYDLVMRLPRFMKTTMAPLYSAILPISSYIDETTDTRRMLILARSSFVLPSAILIPVLVVIAIFSRDILKIWVGAEHADQWPWLALALVSPAISVMLSSGQAAMMVRAEFMRISNRLLYLQVLIQYLITLVFLHWFHEMAFIIGWVFSYIVVSPLIAHYVLRAMGLNGALFWEQIARHAAVAGILAVVVLLGKSSIATDDLARLVVVGGVSCALAWTLSACIALSSSDRAMFGRFVRAMTPH
ncbi:lipopolysaccharide biosynthesis protein [Bradyrhizobium lablabi]|uniref:lipopolysaccharide biosynthesis protein n=1 Tax=Bradyrhizobium lablabi TaxID=722472 RepID=UPI001BA8AC63|nr:teichoic acid transporter [Bradyrhizobium lablabi]MBR0694886.1 teichoic acid transporter [Bradyrhizobium lablabi]